MLVLTSRAEVGEFQITIKVVDEAGNPMPEIKIGASFFQSKLSVPITAHDLAERQINLITDTNGLAVIDASSVYDRHVWYGVDSPQGYYYENGGECIFKEIESGKWQPWNPTVQFVLKPIGVRVPMYAKKVDWNTSLPENNKPIGYDLEIGDWVAPYGKGITSDFFFTLERKFTSVTQDFSATLTLTFPNDGDGIQSVMSDASGSTFRIPRSAPENGYDSKLVMQMYRENSKPIVGATPDPNQNYFFRVRTKKDHQNNIVSAMYGKIYGNIGWDIFHSATAQLSFTYYLNPKLNSRITEFDPKQNLMTNLKFNEGVSAP